MHLFSVYFDKTNIRNGAKMGPLKALTYKLYHLDIHYVSKSQEDRTKIILGKYTYCLGFLIPVVIVLYNHCTKIKAIMIKWIFFSFMGSQFGLSGISSIPCCFIFKCKSSLLWFCFSGRVIRRSHCRRNQEKKGDPYCGGHFFDLWKNSSPYLKIRECWWKGRQADFV